MLSLFFKVNDESIKVEVTTESYTKTEILYNDLKQADNSVRFNCVYTIELANFLKAYINSDILVEIYKDDVIDFTGYVRKNIKYQKTQINQPITIDVVSPSYLLDKTVSNGIVYISQTIRSIVEDLLSRAGFTKITSTSVLGNKSVSFLQVKDNSSIKTAISDILFQYGYGFDFDKTGGFYAFNLFDVPATSTISKLFNGQNCLDRIEINSKEHQFDGVRASFGRVSFHPDSLIFKDTTGATEDRPDECKQTVLPGHFFADKEYNFLNCDSDYGNIVYISKITQKNIKTDSSLLSWNVSKNDLDPLSDGRDLGTQLSFTAFNADTVEHNLTQISINADVYTVEEQQEITAFGDKKTNTLSLNYVMDPQSARDFTKNLCEWYRYNTSQITLKSKMDYKVGDFVAVTDYGIGTYYGRIVKKVSRLSSDIYEYTIDSITEFTPADPKEKQTITSKYGYSAIASAIARAKEYTDQEVTSAQINASPIYSVFSNAEIIRRNSDGSFEPSFINFNAVKTEGLSSQVSYIGVWKVYINGNAETYISTSNSELSIDMNQIRESFDDVNKIDVEFYSTSGEILISRVVLPVLTNSNTYSVAFPNNYMFYECDENGNVTERIIKVRPKVFYGLTELPFGPSGWEYGNIETAPGFDITIDDEGFLVIKAEAGSDMATIGAIQVPLFVHTSDDKKYYLGFNDETRTEYTIGDPETGFEVGFKGPGESGYFYAYFQYQKMIDSAIKYASLSNRIDGFWNILTDDNVITISEKNTLARILSEMAGEFAVYSTKYYSYKKYNAYKSAYQVLLTAINTILNYPGNYTFESTEDKINFNLLFTNYQNARAELDEEISTTPVYAGPINNVSMIPQDPILGTYFLWSSDPVVYDGIQLLLGMTYVYDGTHWTQDNNSSHIMTSMNDAFQILEGSTDTSIPAITFAKRLVALQVVTRELLTRFIEIDSIHGELESGDTDDWAIRTKDFNPELSDIGFGVTRRGNLFANSGVFKGDIFSGPLSLITNSSEEKSFVYSGGKTLTEFIASYEESAYSVNKKEIITNGIITTDGNEWTVTEFTLSMQKRSTESVVYMPKGGKEYYYWVITDINQTISYLLPDGTSKTFTRTAREVSDRYTALIVRDPRPIVTTPPQPYDNNPMISYATFNFYTKIGENKLKLVGVPTAETPTMEIGTLWVDKSAGNVLRLKL